MLNRDLIGRIIYSNSFNPWFNLALEEYLLENAKDNEIIFYLWQNANTVVIGSNQNPWKECNIEALNNEEGKLARRLSGGGAVYHDMGNLNFTFITSKDNFNIEKQLSVIIDAVGKFNVEALFSGRNDIEVEGKKFSGNAFYYGEENSYHHGTLLLDVDKSKLSRYLQVSKEKIQSKGIDSVKSRVVNLKELNSDIDISSLKKALVESFKKIYSLNAGEFIAEEEKFNEIKELYKKYSSWQWIYGETPIFHIKYEKRLSFGSIDINLNVSKGIINEVKVYSDALKTSLPYAIEKALKGINFEKASVLMPLKNIKDESIQKEMEEIVLWLQEDF
ncbi:lipoate--protein ligase [Clostridium amazonitimonense]|uniref:lipoate--protein ligase n=1 Tax=Clostridium amazonitimonense TaxID=1499689 RepID=UPI0005093C80|nr:lipoate--protein ligase [Clostridium amazonitimonense]